MIAMEPEPGITITIKKFKSSHMLISWISSYVNQDISKCEDSKSKF